MASKHELYDVWMVGSKVRVMLSDGIMTVKDATKTAAFYIQNDKYKVEQRKRQLHASQMADYADALTDRIRHRDNDFIVTTKKIEGVEDRYYKKDVEVEYGMGDGTKVVMNLTASNARKMIAALTSFLEENQNIEPLENHAYELADSFYGTGK